MFELLTSECERILKKYLKNELLTAEVVPLQNQNFLLKVTVFDGTQDKSLNFFAKSTGKAPEIHQILFEDFKNIVPKFNPRITPKLYFSNSNLLLFEDLTWQGFRKCKDANLNLDHVKVVLKILAKFHSGSLAFEEIKSVEMGKTFRLDQQYQVDHVKLDIQKVEVKKLMSSLKNEDDLEEFLEEIEERQVGSTFRRTFCHGNLTTENIMFKYEEELPVECRLINFKTKQYVPPICDVLQLIFLNTPEEFRQQHLDSILFYYHNCLLEELQQHFIKMDTITYEQLRKESHHFLPIIKLENYLLYSNHDSSEELKEIFNYPILSREDCYSIIRTKLGTPNYKLLRFKITPLDQVNGYLGTYHKLNITISHKFQETINCFVKTVPKNTSSKNIVQETACFFKEIFIYQTLVPEMQKFGIHTIAECVPTCYFQRSEDLVVFNDLTLQDYRSLPAQIPYDSHLLALTVKKLAQFHASIIVFEEKKSEELARNYRLVDDYQTYLKEIFFSQEPHSGAKVFQAGIRSIPDVIDLFPEMKTEENLRNFTKVWPELREIFFEVIKPSDSYRNVLSHGDLWTNNIMVKFDGEKPVDCAFVDYQCTRYCPPAHDFLSAVYLTTDRATRMECEEDMKRKYFEEFVKILDLYGVNSARILTFDDFLQSVELIRPQMVLQAIMYKSFTLCTSEEISSLLMNEEATSYVFFEDRKEYLAKICDRSEVAKKNLQDCVIDLYSLCDSMSVR